MGDQRKKYVFVIGAGASKEFGLPTGADLLKILEEISGLHFRNDGGEFVGDIKLYETFKLMAKNEDGPGGVANKYLYESWFIKKNMHLVSSIDNFIHTHSDNKRLVNTGKLLLASAILECERASTLCVNNQEPEPAIRFSQGRQPPRMGGYTTPPPSRTWIAELFKLIVPEKNYYDFLREIENCTFISFNYDRCLEQFFVYATASYFRKGFREAKEILDKLNIVHPYGSVGEYVIDDTGRSNFGNSVYGSDLIDAPLKLRTFTEGLESENTVLRIDDAFSNCNIVVFLGFGFIPLNMKILFPGKNYDVDRVIGTYKGLSEESATYVAKDLRQALLNGDHPAKQALISTVPGRVELSNLTCSELFWKHWRFLLANQ